MSWKHLFEPKKCKICKQAPHPGTVCKTGEEAGPYNEDDSFIRGNGVKVWGEGTIKLENVASYLWFPSDSESSITIDPAEVIVVLRQAP